MANSPAALHGQPIKADFLSENLGGTNHSFARLQVFTEGHVGWCPVVRVFEAP